MPPIRSEALLGFLLDQPAEATAIFGEELVRQHGAKPPSAEHDADEGPCRGCQHADRCGLQELACAAFSLFVVHRAGPERYNAAPRQPDAATFQRIFASAPIKGPERASRRETAALLDGMVLRGLR